MAAHYWLAPSYYCHSAYRLIKLSSSKSLKQLLGCICLINIILWSNLLFAASKPIWKSPNEDNFVLLEVRLGNTLLSDLITAYQHDSGVVIPLGQLSDILDIAIDVQAEKGQASGFILQEERSFFLDVGRKELELNKELSPFNNSLVLVNQDDIYVESQLLSMWLPIDFNVDLFSSRLNIDPREPLPMQQRAEREQRIQKALSRSKKSKTEYPQQSMPYRLWDTPMIDQALTINGMKSENSNTDYNINYSALLTGDLLHMDTSLYLELTRDENLKEFRPSFSRKSNDANLLGPMNLTEVNFGYITFPNMPMISTSPPSSQGFMVSNYPLTHQSTYDTQTFQGDLPPDWEVELYHNNSLINYQKSDINREYSFQNVQLLFGRNIFRLVFYGPQGQQREEEHVYEVGSQLTSPGNFYYRTAQRWDEAGNSRTEAQIDYGLHKQLSLSASYANLFFREQRQQYAQVAVNTLLGSYFLRASHIATDQSTSASQLNLQTRVGGINVNGSLIHFDHFVSEEFTAETDPLAWRYYLRLDSAIPSVSFVPRIPINFEIEQDQLESGLKRRRLGNRMFVYMASISFANQLNWVQDSRSVDFINGSIQLSRRLGNHGLRINSSYELHPESKFTSVSSIFNFNLKHGQRINIGLNHSITDGVTRYNAGYSKNVGKVSIGFNGQYSENNSASLALTLAAGLGRDPIKGRWRSNAGSIAKRGAVSARVFLDEDDDNQYDSGEPLIPDTGFSINNSQSKARSDEQGIIFANGLMPYKPTNISLAVGTLEDPAWIPKFKGIQFTPRPGKTFTLDIPIVESGEIDGTTYLQRDGKNIIAGDVEIELINEQGQIISKTTSAFDGFYILSNIPPGSYLLRINPEQFNRLSLTGPIVQIVKINSKNQFIYGHDLVLTR